MSYDRDDMKRARAQARYNAPFASLTFTKEDATSDERTAHAMEYAAAQLGEIRRLLEEKAKPQTES